MRLKRAYRIREARLAQAERAFCLCEAALDARGFTTRILRCGRLRTRRERLPAGFRTRFDRSFRIHRKSPFDRMNATSVRLSAAVDHVAYATSRRPRAPCEAPGKMSINACVTSWHCRVRSQVYLQRVFARRCT